MMNKGKFSSTAMINKLADWFEKTVIVSLALILIVIVVLSVLRIYDQFFDLVFSQHLSLRDIKFEDYQVFFGKIMALLITLEFLNSILKVLNVHDGKHLVNDVIFIAALAVARKLIIYDYNNVDPAALLAMGGLLIAIGVFYYLVMMIDGKYPAKNLEKK